MNIQNNPICPSPNCLSNLTKQGLDRHNRQRFKCPTCKTQYNTDTLSKKGFKIDNFSDDENQKRQKLDKIIGVLLKSGYYTPSNGWQTFGFFSLFDMAEQSKDNKDFLKENLTPIARKIISLV